jgi:hypothetical protein
MVELALGLKHDGPMVLAGVLMQKDCGGLVCFPGPDYSPPSRQPLQNPGAERVACGVGNAGPAQGVRPARVVKISKAHGGRRAERSAGIKTLGLDVIGEAVYAMETACTFLHCSAGITVCQCAVITAFRNATVGLELLQ